MTSNKLWELEVKHHQESNCALLAFLNPDLRTTDHVRTLEIEFAKVMGNDKASNFIIDFSGVKTMPTTVLAVILHAMANAEKGGKHVRLCSMSRQVKKVLEMINVKNKVEIYDSARDALGVPWRDSGRWWKIW